jgi:type I restriction enzyme, R subunit
MTHLTEETLEQTTLAWFENLGYNIEYGPDIAFDGSRPERDAKANYTDVILGSRLQEALERINPEVPFEAIDEAIRKIYASRKPIADRKQPHLSQDAHRWR